MPPNEWRVRATNKTPCHDIVFEDHQGHHTTCSRCSIWLASKRWFKLSLMCSPILWMTFTTICPLLSTIRLRSSSILMCTTSSIPQTRSRSGFPSAMGPYMRSQQDHHPPLQVLAVPYRLKKPLHHAPSIPTLMLLRPQAICEADPCHQQLKPYNSQTLTTNSMSSLITSQVRRQRQCTRKASPSCTTLPRHICTRS